MRIEKFRYEYIYEIDVFQDKLKGLVVIEVEFNSGEDMGSFTMPSFCLEDITVQRFIAGGYLAGKSYEEIEIELNKFNYKNLE